jgi:hypothetical protein
MHDLFVDNKAWSGEDILPDLVHILHILEFSLKSQFSERLLGRLMQHLAIRAARSKNLDFHTSAPVERIIA